MPLPFPYHYKIETIPFGAAAFLKTIDGRLPLGQTPTLFKSPERRLLKAGGGSEIVPSTGNEYVLEQQEIEKLIAAAKKIGATLEPARDASGQPRPWDIEFGFEGGELRLFQIRPLVRWMAPREVESEATVDLSGVPSA